MIAPALTIRRLIEGHYLEFLEDTAADGTIRDYRAALNAWDRFGQPRKPIDDLYADDFKRFCLSATAAGTSPATVDKWLRVYRAGCRFGMSEGLIDRVPVMRPLPQPEQIKWRPTLAELSKLHRAARVARWPDRAGGPAKWWRAFFVLVYVGALRRSDCLNHLRWDQVQADGIHGRRVKRNRLTFIPMLPCVRSHLSALDSDSAFILPCPSGPRQFKAAQDAIGNAAGVFWTPHAIKRTATDEWFAADTSGTAGHIISHARQSVTIRNYLDRVRWLKTVAPKLAIPDAFGGRQRKESGDGDFLRRYRRLTMEQRRALESVIDGMAG